MKKKFRVWRGVEFTILIHVWCITRGHCVGMRWTEKGNRKQRKSIKQWILICTALSKWKAIDNGRLWKQRCSPTEFVAKRRLYPGVNSVSLDTYLLPERYSLALTPSWSSLLVGGATPPATSDSKKASRLYSWDCRCHSLPEHSKQTHILLHSQASSEGLYWITHLASSHSWNFQARP